MRGAGAFLFRHITRARIQVEIPDQALASWRANRSCDFRLDLLDRKQPGVGLNAANDVVEFFPPRIPSPEFPVQMGRLPHHNRRRGRDSAGPGRIVDRMPDDLGRIRQVPVRTRGV